MKGVKGEGRKGVKVRKCERRIRRFEIRDLRFEKGIEVVQLMVLSWRKYADAAVSLFSDPGPWELRLSGLRTIVPDEPEGSWNFNRLEPETSS